jgi:hypothetical protein
MMTESDFHGVSALQISTSCTTQTRPTARKEEEEKLGGTFVTPKREQNAAEHSE